MRDDPPLPLVFSRDQAMAAGMSRHQIARRVRTLSWRPLRRALYIEERRYAELSDREQHMAAVVATLMARADWAPTGQAGTAGSDNELVASHLSAAVAYGWVLPLAGTGPAALTDGNLDASTRQAHLHGREQDILVQVASLPTSDVRTCSVEMAGTRFELRATSRARTVADNLRHLPNADGVALADSAFATGRRVLRTGRGGPGSPAELAVRRARPTCPPDCGPET
jgi:hypothetical protein